MQNSICRSLAGPAHIKRSWWDFSILMVEIIQPNERIQIQAAQLLRIQMFLRDIQRGSRIPLIILSALAELVPRGTSVPLWVQEVSILFEISKKWHKRQVDTLFADWVWYVSYSPIGIAYIPLLGCGWHVWNEKKEQTWFPSLWEEWA